MTRDEEREWLVLQVALCGVHLTLVHEYVLAGIRLDDAAYEDARLTYYRYFPAEIPDEVGGGAYARPGNP